MIEDKIDPKLKKKWVKALLSGDYAQGRRQLYDKKSDTHCCLGVLARVMGYSDDQLDGRAMLSSLEEVPLSKKMEVEFVYMNDGHEMPFDLIAGFINEYL